MKSRLALLTVALLLGSAAHAGSLKNCRWTIPAAPKTCT